MMQQNISDLKNFLFTSNSDALYRGIDFVTNFKTNAAQRRIAAAQT